MAPEQPMSTRNTSETSTAGMSASGTVTTVTDLTDTTIATIDMTTATIDIVGAASLGRLDLIKNFSNATKVEIQSAFMTACEFGRTQVVEFLLDKGADMRGQDGNGQTGLHSAALAGHVHTVKLLLERRAPLEVQNVWGGTVLGNVLWGAIHHDPNVDYVPIVEMLINAGAKVPPEFLTWWRAQDPLVASAKPRIEELLRRGLQL